MNMVSIWLNAISVYLLKLPMVLNHMRGSNEKKKTWNITCCFPWNQFVDNCWKWPRDRTPPYWASASSRWAPWCYLPGSTTSSSRPWCLLSPWTGLPCSLATFLTRRLCWRNASSRPCWWNHVTGESVWFGERHGLDTRQHLLRHSVAGAEQPKNKN